MLSKRFPVYTIYMIQKAKKRTLFLVGLLFTGIIASIAGQLRSGYSKEESLFVSTASADVASYTGGQWTGDGCAGCCDGCFPADTLVSTPEGQKKIQDIQEGETVYGFNAETGAVTVSTVTKTFKHSWEEVGEASPLVVVAHEKGTLTLTTNHPVYKKGSISKEGFQDFENAGNLKIGDVLTTESGDGVAIVNIMEGPQYDYIYNLEVGEVHTYNAGGIRVHNKY
jgi:hypothetical protein